MAPRPGLLLLASARLVEHPPYWKRFPSKTCGPAPLFSCSGLTRLDLVLGIWAGTLPVIDGHFFFSLTPLLKRKPWQIWLPPFSTLSLIGNKVRQVANEHSLDCVLWLTRGFQGYNIDATYLTAFRCKNISAHLLLAQNLLCLLLYRALQVETEPLLPRTLRLTQDTLQLLVLKEGEQRADVCLSCV